jgi:hypothetical protein
MRIFVAAAVAAAIAWSAPASAQSNQFSSVTAIAGQVYASCVSASRRAGLYDPRLSCACVTGYMGASMNDRDYEVASVLLRVGEMAETGASQMAIEAEITEFFQRGFTEDDVKRVAATVQQIAARGDAVCSQFESTGSV